MVVRKPLQGTAQILRYNWGFYVFALLMLGVGAGVLAFLPLPDWVEWLGAAVEGLGVWWLCASVFASFWVYDSSELMAWEWLQALLPERPKKWVNLHAGLDESTAQFSRMWGPPLAVFDFFDKREMTEKSIHRARASAKDQGATSVSFRELPLEDRSADLACVIFSAHELRSVAARNAFFKELDRILLRSGRLLVVEHARDAANFVAFGPGFLHFLPDVEWKRLGKFAGLERTDSGRITPFVRYYLWEKP